MRGFFKFLLTLTAILVILSFIGVEPLANYKEAFFKGFSIETPEGETSNPKETSEEPPHKAKLAIPAPLQIHNLVNVERQKRGVLPVKWSESLAKMAQSQAEHCAEIGYLKHSSRYAFQGGENLFWSTGMPDAQAVVATWMSSTQGHREFLLSPRAKYAGVGVASKNGKTVAAWAFADMALFTEFGD